MTTHVHRFLGALAFGAAFFASPGYAADVATLSLPKGFTVSPEGEVRLVTISRDGTIAALAQSIEPENRTLAVRWDRSGRRTTFEALPVTTAPDRGRGDTGPVISGIVAASGVTYVNVGEPFGGAYSGLSVETQRWIGASAFRWNLTACDSGDDDDQHAYGADGSGQVAVTFDRTGRGSYLVMNDRIDSAPYAFVVDAKGCHERGRAVIFGVRGAWGAGYRGYLDGKIAPTNLNQVVQRAVAVRWRGIASTELGDGVAFAVSEDGYAVGASALPGRFITMTTNFFDPSGRRYDSAIPHAVAWDASGRRIAVETRSKRSVAYDVGNDGTIVGMLQERDGKHYAFLARGGVVRRLDDLPHLSGWRFEAAYSIAEDGTIVIGTRNNIPSVFRWNR